MQIPPEDMSMMTKLGKILKIQPNVGPVRKVLNSPPLVANTTNHVFARPARDKLSEEKKRAIAERIFWLEKKLDGQKKRKKFLSEQMTEKQLINSSMVLDEESKYLIKEFKLQKARIDQSLEAANQHANSVLEKIERNAEIERQNSLALQADTKKLNIGSKSLNGDSKIINRESIRLNIESQKVILDCQESLEINQRINDDNGELNAVLMSSIKQSEEMNSLATTLSEKFAMKLQQSKSTLDEINFVANESRQTTNKTRELIAEIENAQKESRQLNTEAKISISESKTYYDKFNTIQSEWNRVKKHTNQLNHLSKISTDESITLIVQQKASLKESQKQLSELGATKKASMILNANSKAILEQGQQLHEKIRSSIKQSDTLVLETNKALTNTNRNNLKVDSIFNQYTILSTEAERLNDRTNSLNAASSESIEKFKTVAKKYKSEVENLDNVLQETKIQNEISQSLRNKLLEENTQSAAITTESARLNNEAKDNINRHIEQTTELQESLAKSHRINQSTQEKLAEANRQLKQYKDSHLKAEKLYLQTKQTLDSNRANTQQSSKTIDESNSVIRSFQKTIAEFNVVNIATQRSIKESQLNHKKLKLAYDKLAIENTQLKQKSRQFEISKSQAPTPQSKAHALDIPIEIPRHVKSGSYFSLLMVLAFVLPITFILYTALQSFGRLNSAALDNSIFDSSKVSIGQNISDVIDQKIAPILLKAAAHDTKFQWPIDRRYIDPSDIIYDERRRGISIFAEQGEAIVAVSDGEVIYSDKSLKGYGNLIMIKHSDELISIYASNHINFVSVGDKVEKGQVIADVGKLFNTNDSGLYFEVRYNGKAEDPFHYLSQNS